MTAPTDWLRACGCRITTRGLVPCADHLAELAGAGAGPTAMSSVEWAAAFADRPMVCDSGCGEQPHRWRPSPEAGPHWRCGECGEVTESSTPAPPEPPTPTRAELLALVERWERYERSAREYRGATGGVKAVVYKRCARDLRALADRIEAALGGGEDG